ncbi:hypothetical protein ABZS66_11500, partial [Dactylosporangium sp. NPDC005572]|uniref:hypothetical protein n=1 Tax=Dactylosporangium sp. NPDC005572 TaxID=3156889 RepID=UPI0033A28C93
MTQPLDWWPATRDVLGAEGDIEVPRITQPSWVVLDMSFWGVTERYGKKPWNHWMPADAAHPGWNKITLYRKRKVSDGDLGYFQMIRGWFTFWEGGEQSPARQSQDLVNKSEATIASIANNPFLDAETFYRAAHLFYEVANWLMNTGRPAILDVVGQVDQDASGFQGSAADAFVFAMEDFAAAMLFLKENITEPTDWIELLNDNGDAVNAFKSAMQSAWSAFKDYHYYDPNWLLLDLVRSMEQQIDAYDAEVSQFEVTSDSNESWNFSFPEQGLPGPYNLLWGDEWVRLNADLKSTWTNKMVELDAAARTATQTLVDSYNTTMQSMQRGVLPLHKTAFPVQVDDPLAAAGGGDFPGGGDFGGGDFGGGGDFAGGGDFGGGDFAGGGDFPGGGDFAGGGDFPGGGDFAGG